jgi:thiol-disulfide isomerase/thioredoxin
MQTEKIIDMTKTIFGFLAIMSIFFMTACDSELPEIKRGEFLVKSSLGDKIVSGEVVEIYYHLQKGEELEYFDITTRDYYDNYFEKYYKPIIKDSICSFKLEIPDNIISLYVLVGGNMNCFTGGASSVDYIIYNNDGTIKDGSNRLLFDELDKSDTAALDSAIKYSFKNYPDNFMILDSYWDWLSQNDERKSQLHDVIRKLKETISETTDENLALICKGYYYLSMADSMSVYLEKYIENSSFPGFAPSLVFYLEYLNYRNDLPFEKKDIFQNEIALKCPLSSTADMYLEKVVSLENRDTLSENIIALKVEQSDDGYYYKALYDLYNLKDTSSSKKAALKYLNYTKNAFIPNSIQTSQTKDVIQIPKIYELLADVSKHPHKSYDYIKKALDNNRNLYSAGKLHAKAAEYAFKCGDMVATENHIIQICNLGKVRLAKTTISKLYAKEHIEEQLNMLFKSAAGYCDTVPDLIFQIDSITKYSTCDNKIIFLNLWNPGCAPCIKEIPNLNKLRNSFNSDNIIWLARDFGEEYMDKLPSKFKGWSLYQRNNDINKIFYKESVNPQAYIIDSHKRIRCHTIGYDENTMEDYKIIIELLLKE